MTDTEKPPQINDLVVEFAVLDWRASLAFYKGALGFDVLFERPEDRFLFLQIGGAQLMIYEANRERNLTTCAAPLTRPLGHGMNVQIAVPDAAAMLARAQQAGARLVLPLEDRAYRTGPVMRHVRQCAVADPDGYVLRFAEVLATRPL